jgi:hypothetical protein
VRARRDELGALLGAGLAPAELDGRLRALRAALPANGGSPPANANANATATAAPASVAAGGITEAQLLAAARASARARLEVRVSVRSLRLLAPRAGSGELRLLLLPPACARTADSAARSPPLAIGADGRAVGGAAAIASLALDAAPSGALGRALARKLQTRAADGSGTVELALARAGGAGKRDTLLAQAPLDLSQLLGARDGGELRAHALVLRAPPREAARTGEAAAEGEAVAEVIIDTLALRALQTLAAYRLDGGAGGAESGARSLGVEIHALTLFPPAPGGGTVATAAAATAAAATAAASADAAAAAVPTAKKGHSPLGKTTAVFQPAAASPAPAPAPSAAVSPAARAAAALRDRTFFVTVDLPGGSADGLLQTARFTLRAAPPEAATLAQGAVEPAARQPQSAAGSSVSIGWRESVPLEGGPVEVGRAARARRARRSSVALHARTLALFRSLPCSPARAAWSTES